MPPRAGQGKSPEVMRKIIREAEAKKAAESEKSSGVQEKVKRRRKRNYQNFYPYIHKVLQQIHPNTGISQKGMQVMNSCVHDIIGRLGQDCEVLRKQQKSRTINVRTVQSSVRLLFPGELAKHAVAAGTKATTKFSASQS